MTMIYFDKRLLAAALSMALLAACQSTSGAKHSGALAEDDGISPAAKRSFEEAVQSFEEGKQLGVMDWAALRGKFEAVIAKDDRLAEAHFNLGVIAAMEGAMEEAASHYRNAIARKPGLFEARENLGLALQELGDDRGAEEQYKEILRMFPDHAGARARLGALHLASGNSHRALELAREALLREPENLAALRLLVEIHLTRGELEVARLVALRMGRIDGAGPEGPYLLGRVLEEQGRKGAAVHQYQRAAALSPHHLPSRTRLAGIFLADRRYAEAEALLEELISLRPDGFEALFNLGVARYGKGDHEGAMKSLRAAQELRPHDVRPSYPIALILHKHSDQPEEALQQYRRYVSGAPFHLRPDHPVFSDLRECEQLVQFLAQVRAEEEAQKRREEARLAVEAANGEAPRGVAASPKTAAGETDPDLVLPEGLDPDEPVDEF